MSLHNVTIAFFTGAPGWAELVVVAAVGLLIFGRRLPEVGRSLGRGIVEFKKGLRGIEEEVEDAVRNDQPDHYKTLDERSESAGSQSSADSLPND